MDDDTINRRPSIEETLEELSKAVTTGFATVGGQLTEIHGTLTNVEGRLTNVESRLTNVEGRLTNVEGRLTTIEVFAENTDMLCRNIWDAQTSLARRMEEGFKEAKKERDEQFDVLKLAIHSWGARVETLETRRARATKRRR